MGKSLMRAVAGLAAGAIMLAVSAGASAQTVSAISGAELEQVLAGAGLSPAMTEDAATGAPVAGGRAGEVTFWVRALDCSGRPAACETLMFFANFELGRAATPADFRLINRFNDSQVFGRAYVLEAQSQVGVDYVIELAGGVSMDNLTQNIARWSDVIAAFIENFRAGQKGSS